MSYPSFTGAAKIALVAGLVLTLAPAAVDAQSFRASNGLSVNATGGKDFEVVFLGGALENAYWCAAADYVIDGLGAMSRTRLFRASPTPRKQAQGISFTLDPGRATQKTGLTLFGSPDGTLSAGMARSVFCREDPMFGFP